MLLPLTTTKLLDFLRNHIIISHVHKEQNVCRANGTPFLRLIQTHLLFEQHNKQFGSDFENLTCPSPAFTHAFILLVKFLTTLLMASCLRSLAVLAGDSDGFQF